ncbi:MAG: GIY-YIG nuclease family protein [Verrucomicrobiota bacterium]|nr:GIY-YIG nuclease family protein [Verrucomicrobiota bacterium]
MSAISKEQLIEQLQRVTRDNGGRPPGESRFYREAKLTKESLWDADICSYGDLCELAGLPRNRLQQQMTPDQLFEPLALLTAKLKRFPNHTDREMARRRDVAFPSYEAYRTAQDKSGALELQLLDWCRSRPEHSAALEIMEAHVSQQDGRPQPTRRGQRPVNGYVYLMRYGNSGRDYKLGMTERVERRHAQISGMFPGDVRVIHVIETDDPAGIERYWKRRFESKRVPDKDEIFRLLPEDVAAFKWRKYQ